MKPGNIRCLVFLCLSIISCEALSAAQQRPGGDPELTRPMVGNLVVRVRDVTGGPLPYAAMVHLSALIASHDFRQPTREGGQAEFRAIPLGIYHLEVTAPGFTTAEVEAEVTARDMTTTVFVEMRPESLAQPAATISMTPVLAPKARKEIEKGVEALRVDNLKEAQSKLERAQKLAPGHPDVQYLLGVLFIKLHDLAKAREHLERAVALQPNHVAAQHTLGALLLNLGERQPAIRALEQAIIAGRRSWETHWTLANAYFEEKQFERARVHAERAIELALGKAPAPELLLIRTLLAEDNRAEATKRVESFVGRFADHPLAAEARKLQAEIRAAAAAASASANVSPPASAPAPVPVPILPTRDWAPPDVDEVVPPVASDVTCSLPAVLSEAGQRVKALVDNLQRFTANELIEHSEIDSAGHIKLSQSKTVEYLVEIREIRPGILSVEETRGPSGVTGAFPTRLASTGLAAVALVFHPYYVDDFEMRCEGLGRWKGEPVWQVHFRQRADRPARIRSYRTDARRYPVPLKGRAWISAANYQVVRLEAALTEPIRPVKLERDHLIVDYRPVEFTKRKTRLWLPLRSELYIQLRGRRYVHRHNFSDYQLFSVDVELKVQPPEQQK